MGTDYSFVITARSTAVVTIKWINVFPQHIIIKVNYLRNLSFWIKIPQKTQITNTSRVKNQNSQSNQNKISTRQNLDILDLCGEYQMNIIK